MSVASGSRPLEGAEIALTGRLACMSRREARERIEAAGGSYAAAPGASTRYLVVGQDGPPLDEEGRLTESLRRARELGEHGAPIRVLREEDWLALIGLEERQADVHRLYTTAQLGRILGLPASRVRSWVRQGLVQPAKVVGRLAFFDFAQIASARALARLTYAGVTPARIKKSLKQLQAWMPEAAHSLAPLAALEEEGELFVRLADGSLAEPSGQLRLEFDDPPAAELDEAPGGTRFPARWMRVEPDSASLFERGICAEQEEQLEEAAALYRAALAAGGPDPEILFNLGNVLYAQDRKVDAAALFRESVELDPDWAEAWNNYGNALSQADRVEEGLAAYRRAIQLDPLYADAHYNLAETFAERGERSAAVGHWRAYLEREPTGPWADAARERLAGAE